MKKYWLPFLWMVIIFILCAIPKNDVPHISWLPVPYTDKIVHSVFYIVAALLWCNSFQFKSKFIKVFIICFSYGVLMEILQLYIFTSRSAEVADVVANSVGAIIGLILYRYTSLS